MDSQNFTSEDLTKNKMNVSKLQTIVGWLNENQGLLTVILFLFSLLLGWISGFFKWVLSKPKSNTHPASVIADRFLKIFNDHDIPTVQIPSVFKEIELKDLSNMPDSLVSVLTDEKINKVANMFGVNRDWLDGVSNMIYEPLYCYKEPEKFFEDIAGLDLSCSGGQRPIIVLTDGDDLKKDGFNGQTLVIVLVKKLCDFNGRKIYTFKIYDDDWDWKYFKCRIQLRAMFRVLFKLREVTIPMYKVDKNTLEQIISGKKIPNIYKINAKKLNIYIEDFSLSPEESAVSKDWEELGVVDDYIKRKDLYNIALEYLNKKC